MGRVKGGGHKRQAINQSRPGATKTACPEAHWQLSNGIRHRTLWKNRFQWSSPDKSLSKQMSKQLQDINIWTGCNISLQSSFKTVTREV